MTTVMMNASTTMRERGDDRGDLAVHGDAHEHAENVDRQQRDDDLFHDEHLITRSSSKPLCSDWPLIMVMPTPRQKDNTGAVITSKTGGMVISKNPGQRVVLGVFQGTDRTVVTQQPRVTGLGHQESQEAREDSEIVSDPCGYGQPLTRATPEIRNGRGHQRHDQRGSRTQELAEDAIKGQKNIATPSGKNRPHTMPSTMATSTRSNRFLDEKEQTHGSRSLRDKEGYPDNDTFSRL